MKHHERTRQLIELGGLLAQAGLVELTDGDRAAIYGMLVEAAARLRMTVAAVAQAREARVR